MEIITSLAVFHLASSFVEWAQDTGLRLLFIIIGAWLLRRILVTVVAALLRRALHLEQAFQTDLDREKRMETFIALINAVLSMLVWAVAGMLLLQEAGIKPGPLITGAGVLGVGIAFGAQALMKDFISGLFIVLENQYRVGDEVELDTTAGTVEHLGIRTTVLRDDEGNVHFVPNGLIQRTTNKSMGFVLLRLSLVAHVGPEQYDTVKRAINQIGTKLRNEKKWLPHFDEPLAFKEMGEVTEKKAEFIITARVKRAYDDDITTELRTRLLDRLEQKGIKVKKFEAKPLETPASTEKDKEKEEKKK